MPIQHQRDRVVLRLFPVGRVQSFEEHVNDERVLWGTNEAEEDQ